MKDHSRSAMLMAALGNGIFGFSFMFSQLAMRVTEPFVLLMYRFDLTFLLLLGMAAAASRRVKDEQSWMHFSLRGKSILPLVGMGLIQPVGYFLCESYGISLTNSTFAGVLIALIPIAAMAGGAIQLGEAPRVRQIAWAVLSIAGVVVITVQQQSEGAIQPLGVALLVGAVLTGAYFHVLSRRIAGRYSPLERTVVMMGMAAAVFTTLALIQHRSAPAALVTPLRDGGFLAALGYLSVCSSIVAFMALNYADSYIPVAKTAAFANLTTIISIAAGAVFLHEPFGWLTIPGALMIVLGIWGVQKS